MMANTSMPFEYKTPKPRTLGILIFLFVVFIVLWGAFVIIPAGHRGVCLTLVQYKGIEKWNGIVPQISGGAVPFSSPP